MHSLRQTHLYIIYQITHHFSFHFKDLAAVFSLQAVFFLKVRHKPWAKTVMCDLTFMNFSTFYTYNIEIRKAISVTLMISGMAEGSNGVLSS